MYVLTHDFCTPSTKYAVFSSMHTFKHARTHACMHTRMHTHTHTHTRTHAHTHTYTQYICTYFPQSWTHRTDSFGLYGFPHFLKHLHQKQAQSKEPRKHSPNIPWKDIAMHLRCAWVDKNYSPDLQSKQHSCITGCTHLVDCWLGNSLSRRVYTGSSGGQRTVETIST